MTLRRRGVRLDDATCGLLGLGHGLDRDDVRVRTSCTYQPCDELDCGVPGTIAAELRQ